MPVTSSRLRHDPLTFAVVNGWIYPALLPEDNRSVFFRRFGGEGKLPGLLPVELVCRLIYEEKRLYPLQGSLESSKTKLKLG